MHKIVVLDGYVLNPGDLSWAPLETLGNVTVYDRTPAELIVQRIADADIVLTNKTPITRQTLLDCPSVRYVGALATGYNTIDTAAAKEFGVAVTNVPAYSTKAVAQFTMALLLEVCHHVGEHSRGVMAGDWVKSADFSYWNYPQTELDGKTFGIIGMGQIGQATGKLADAFGMKVLYNAHSPKELPYPAEFCPLDELLARADIVSLHCPLTNETNGIINRQSISRMKKGAILLNTARGPLVDEQAVADALRDGKLAGFAADVVSREPMAADSPLLGVPGCILTPHIAWASHAARGRLMDVAIGNVFAFCDGKRQNRVE